MKALSIWQPWASLIADGHKRFETRPRATKYRGPLLICAAKHMLTRSEHQAIFLTLESFRLDYQYGDYFWSRGIALCVVDLVSVWYAQAVVANEHLLESETIARQRQELALGDFSSGRFAWEPANVRKFKEPWPVKGQQGLFNVPDEEIEKHEMES